MKLMNYFHRFNYCIFYLKHYLIDNKFRRLDKCKIVDPKTTLEYIINHRCSVSRFGDGEFALLSGENTGFQAYNKDIASKLKDILISNSPNHIVCLPYPWKSMHNLKYRAFEFWSSFLNNHLDKWVLPNIDLNKLYYDTNFTRFYIDYRSSKHAEVIIPLLKKIWDARDIVIVEGDYSRLGVGNDLFVNAKSISRILCPSQNAFDYYDIIMKSALNQPKSSLILIALGMTATCLSYDLSLLGWQAIDIGHVDIEYEWYRMKAKTKVPVSNKYIAEAKDGLYSTGIQFTDELYNSQIIDRIGV